MAGWTPGSWSIYSKCHTCGVAPGARCIAMGSGGYGVRSGDPLVKPHLGRRQTTTSHRGRRVDPETASLRLAVWKRRALIGDRVADIAAELRMNRAALEQYIVRARKRGHPNAVYHMAAGRT